MYINVNVGIYYRINSCLSYIFILRYIQGSCLYDELIAIAVLISNVCLGSSILHNSGSDSACCFSIYIGTT